MLQPKASGAGYELASGGLHCLHCGPCLGWERNQGCGGRVLVSGNHQVGRLHWGTGSPTDQGRGEGRVPEKEPVKPTADDGWVEIGGNQHSVIHGVRQG